MSLLRRLEQAQQATEKPTTPSRTVAVPVSGPPAPPRSPASPIASRTARTPGRVPREVALRDIRLRLQTEVINAFDDLLDKTGPAQRLKINEIVDRMTAPLGSIITRDDKNRLVKELLDEITGFGPIEPLLHDESITEVMVNGPRQIYVERKGKIERVDVHFLNDEHVRAIIDRIIAPMGRRIDETSPRVDARLPDGSRVNAIIKPLSLVGPVITVRKFATRPYTVDDLIGFGTATPEMFEFLQACIHAHLNIFVSGGTGSGKTTTLNVLSSFIPDTERIVTIEDAAELQMRQTHVITLESRPPNLEGQGEITIRHLLRNALHMRPDRIIVGECRSGEALDMLQAMTTGHDGSLSTGHANTPRDMLRRLETMVLMTGYELPLRAIREQIASAVDLIVHTARLKDGSRRIVNITEVYGIEDDEILTQDIFAFEQTAYVDGKVEGDLKPTGYRPTFMGVFKAAGVELPPGDYGIPPESEARHGAPRKPKGRFSFGGGSVTAAVAAKMPAGYGRAVKAGGMIYVSAMGPIDIESGEVVDGGIEQQTRQCLQNLQRRLGEMGSSLDKVVWANWSLREPSEFDAFNEEWIRAYPEEAPVGQCTVMPPLQRRAGFRISIGVIAEA